MELNKKSSSVTAATMYLSKYQSTNRLSPEIRRSVDLIYAKKPMSKDTPRWNQSTATWRHHSPRYSFSKDQRFRTRKHYYNDIMELEIPSTRSSISCTFGKDNKKPISEVIMRNAK